VVVTGITISKETKKDVRKEIKEAIMGSPTIRKLVAPRIVFDDPNKIPENATKRLSWLN